jgi:hypothetical protein
MPNETSAEPRLLLVVDNDYGALGTMMYFLHGQPLAASALLLLPRRVHELHGPSLAVASRPYDTLADILQAVDAHRPELVLLVSGYLYAAQRLLRVRGVRALIRALGERGCRIATTDPYIGTFREVPAAAVASRDLGPGPIERLTALARGLRLGVHVRRVAPMVERLAHFYPVPMPQRPGGPSRFSFFNPRYIRTEAELRDTSAAVAMLPGMSPGVPRWLFLLARFDLQLQERRRGRQGFANLLAARIGDALDEGRHPTFIGPAACVETLARRFAGDARVTLMTGCPWAEFESRLLDAESAFYWQLFSTSTFLRLWNGLPVFFFDEGHNARLLEPMRRAGLDRYFMGGTPAYLDVEARLDAARFAGRRGEFREAARAALAKLASLPEPSGMVRAILAAR